MKKALIALLLATTMLPTVAKGKDAQCVIKQQGEVVYAGGCQFNPDKGGSFYIKGIGAKNILPSITDISVYIISPGIAEVRGLTIYGNNSRWGPAIRSKKDPACWTGTDFEVCAY
jgi:hypothetical protein